MASRHFNILTSGNAKELCYFNTVGTVQYGNYINIDKKNGEREIECATEISRISKGISRLKIRIIRSIAPNFMHLLPQESRGINPESHGVLIILEGAEKQDGLLHRVILSRKWIALYSAYTYTAADQ